MHIETITVGPFEMNSYVLSDDKTKECIVIDPGAEIEKIIQYIRGRDLKPVSIFATHAHIDHVGYASDIIKELQVPFYMGEADLPILDTLKGQAEMFGITVGEKPAPGSFFTDGQTIDFCSSEIKVLHTPGHSPGSFSFYIDGCVFVGDVLFYNSIGRTDLYKGDYDTLIRSIKEKIFTLPDDTVVYPGHGPDTTVGREKAKNPFFQG
jgi:glyoxylase-like metal-dependent hydrolase (beta-lactamase superfamily II)